MTDPGNVLLGRAQPERAFTALGDRRVRRGVVADVFIVGRGSDGPRRLRYPRDSRCRLAFRAPRCRPGRSKKRCAGTRAATVVAKRAGERLHPGKGRPWQAPRVRPPWPACYRGLTAAHLRDEGACGQDPRHRRPALARRDDRRGLSRNRSSDMCRVLPRRGHPSEVCRCPPRALRQTCEHLNHPARRPAQEQADAGLSRRGGFTLASWFIRRTVITLSGRSGNQGLSGRQGVTPARYRALGARRSRP